MEKYDNIGRSRSKVFLVGIMKLDEYLAEPSNPPAITNRVGICTNILDPIDRVKELCSYLVATHSDKVFILRPHPGDSRCDLWSGIADQFGMELSESCSKAALDFLKEDVDVILAGDANILLEAALLNIYPLYNDFSLLRKDSYGFYHHGLVQERLVTPEETCKALAVCIDEPLPPRIRAKRYCATLGTHYEGRSTELTLELLNQILSGRCIIPDAWHKIEETVNLEAYELM